MPDGRPMAQMPQEQHGKRPIKEEDEEQTTGGGEQCKNNQTRLQLRPFSIDGLLKSVVKSGTNNTINGKCSPKTMIDYFMEERELTWIDGRRGRKKTATIAAAAKGKAKTPSAIYGKETNIREDKLVKTPPQPPLPTSSSIGGGSSSRPKYACPECGKSYATSSNLSRHKQTHRPLDSPHAKKCSFCDRVYVSMPALSMHLLTHQARHKCSICGKLFSRPWLLKGHLRSHTGQKPFGCGNCGKAFSDRSNLRAHLNTHNNDKRWRCDHCGRQFALKSYLAKHLEQQHGQPQQPHDFTEEQSSRSGSSNGDADEGSNKGEGIAEKMMGIGMMPPVALPSLCDDDEEEEEEETKIMMDESMDIDV